MGVWVCIDVHIGTHGAIRWYFLLRSAKCQMHEKNDFTITNLSPSEVKLICDE
jgi:hypothetical protein